MLRTLKDFNERRLDAATAMAELGLSRSQLYRQRTKYLREKQGYIPQPSGGSRHEDWPQTIRDFLIEFLPLQQPPNYQLVADEMLRLYGFRRSRSSVEAYVKAHMADLIPKPNPKPHARRRFRRAFIGELWQHDSSIHQWWPAASKQVLLLTIDDLSGLITAGRFVKADTTWDHFLHFRSAFERRGIPERIYTDGLSLFGPSSTSDHCDPKSQFQQALLGLGIAHIVATSPQAKGKIERRFGTFQRRLVTLLAHAKVTTWEAADKVLQMEIDRQNRTKTRATGKIPEEVWEEQSLSGVDRIRDCPVKELLDIHLSIRSKRRVNLDQTIQFEGQTYEISKTHRKYVTIVQHPNIQFWVLEEDPMDAIPNILGHFTI